MKTCSQCKLEQDSKEFHKDKKNSDRLKSYCRTCARKYNVGKYGRMSKEKRKEYNSNRKRIYKENPLVHQRVLEKRREYTVLNPEKIIFGQAKTRAVKKGLDFNIELSDIIIPEYCPILGIKIKTGYDRVKQRNSASLDRIDITKGYIKGNIAVISDQANTMKNNGTFEQLRSFSKNILKYIGDDIVQSLAKAKSETDTEHERGGN